MTRYATTEKMWECWGCGFDIPLRSMWTNEQYPYTYRCPCCKENILFIDESDNIRRAGAYYGMLPHIDHNDPMFEDNEFGLAHIRNHIAVFPND